MILTAWSPTARSEMVSSGTNDQFADSGRSRCQNFGLPAISAELIPELRASSKSVGTLGCGDRTFAGMVEIDDGRGSLLQIIEIQCDRRARSESLESLTAIGAHRHGNAQVRCRLHEVRGVIRRRRHQQQDALLGG